MPDLYYFVRKETMDNYIYLTYLLTLVLLYSTLSLILAYYTTGDKHQEPCKSVFLIII